MRIVELEVSPRAKAATQTAALISVSETSMIATDSMAIDKFALFLGRLLFASVTRLFTLYFDQKANRIGRRHWRHCRRTDLARRRCIALLLARSALVGASVFSPRRATNNARRRQARPRCQERHWCHRTITATQRKNENKKDLILRRGCFLMFILRLQFDFR